MAQFIFPKWTNAILPTLGLIALAVPLYMVGMVWYGFSPLTTDVGYQPTQPVAFFSHRMHAGELGIDCRYCHNTVERAAKAAIPPTQTCMNCHHAVHFVPDAVNDPTGELRLIQNQKLQPVIDSYFSGQPILWRRVHDLPDYSYFNHSAHVTRGVSCVECHGRVDRMDKVYRFAQLDMGWCLKCHRDPTARLRPFEFITKLDWTPEGATDETLKALRLAIGKDVVTRNAIQPSTDCSTCHR